MKKVLVLTYFFPPCNLTAAQRPYSWANYLSEDGYFPVIITRRWDEEINTPVDAHRDSENGLSHQKFDTHEIFYTPYKSTLRDQLFTKYGDSKYKLVRKALTLLELFAQNFTNYFNPYWPIYLQAKKYLEEYNDVEAIVITGNPFSLFKFGYLLKKEFNVKWIADYRDDWNTQEHTRHTTFMQKTLAKIEAYSEKRWVGTSDLVTSISEHYVNKISKFVNKPGLVIQNGYDSFEEQSHETLNFQDNFTITYTGTLYQIQNIEVFLSAFKRLIQSVDSPNIKLYFLGLEYDRSQAERVKILMKGFEKHIIITERMTRKAVLELQCKAHLLLMVSYGNLRGVPSSKLYEYIGLRKPIIVCPSDNDIIERTLEKVGLGSFANTTSDAFTILEHNYKMFLKGKINTVKPNENEIALLSRKNQTKKLAEAIKRL